MTALSTARLSLRLRLRLGFARLASAVVVRHPFATLVGAGLVILKIADVLKRRTAKG